MQMQQGNFVGQIMHPTFMFQQIKQLFGGDKFTFVAFVNGITEIYYVEVIDQEDATERWEFVRDHTTYPMYNRHPIHQTVPVDKVIRKFTASQVLNQDCSVVDNPSDAITQYISVYLDARQNM